MFQSRWSPFSVHGVDFQVEPQTMGTWWFKPWPFFGWWVHVTRTQGVKTWPPTRRWKGRFESPGMFYFCLKEDSAKWFGGLGGVWDSNTRIPRISLSVNPIFFHFPEKSNRNPNGIRAPRASIKPLAERLHLQLGRPSPPNKKRLRPPLLFSYSEDRFFRSREFVVFFLEIRVFFSRKNI